jgi:phosphoribosylformimino-5-aminoimidazole carboxamide ribonucleotide (ProFAR) isomerase
MTELKKEYLRQFSVENLDKWQDTIAMHLELVDALENAIISSERRNRIVKELLDNFDWLIRS